MYCTYQRHQFFIRAMSFNVSVCTRAEYIYPAVLKDHIDDIYLLKNNISKMFKKRKQIILLPEADYSHDCCHYYCIISIIMLYNLGYCRLFLHLADVVLPHELHFSTSNVHSDIT